MSKPTRPPSLTPERLQAEVTAILRTLDIVAVGLRDIRKRRRTAARLSRGLHLVSSTLAEMGFRAARLRYEANPAILPHAPAGLTHADLDALEAILNGVDARTRAVALGEGEDGAWLRRQLDSLNPTP